MDTNGWHKNPIKLIIQNFLLIKKCKNVIILPANRGVKVFVPFFSIINKFFHRKLHYVVIGGWLPEMLKDHPKLIDILTRFDGLYVETYSMLKALNSMGLYNVYYMPNFKPLKIITKDELVYEYKEPYRLCTFSRVTKKKGIEDAIEAVKKVNSELKRVVCKLDIYGQIDKEYEERFNQLMSNFPSFISYKGIVPFNKTTEILKNYFVLLFPTTYEVEGFPGTLIDAFSAGVPVVASDWKYNSEIVTNGKNGFIYKGGIDSLSKIIKKIVSKPEVIQLMKKNCIIEAKKYESKTVIKEFINKLEMN